MRLNKHISDTGFCSRREADGLIGEGRVTVNGARARIGAEIGEGDEVLVDGKPLRVRKVAPGKRQHIYIALNKPVGVTCTTESGVKDNIVDFVGHERRIFPIGRLDKDSEGLILLTNDGDIVNEVLRAEHNHEKQYVVAVDKPITQEFIDQMAAGVRLSDATTKPCRVKKLGPKLFDIVLTQGLNRQIRRMCEALGFTVEALQRVRIMHIRLGELPLGRWRQLAPQEIAPLLPKQARSPGGPPPGRPGRPPEGRGRRR